MLYSIKTADRGRRTAGQALCCWLLALGFSGQEPRTKSQGPIADAAAVRGLWSAVAAALLLLSGCDTSGPAPFEARYVVEAYLVAGELLAPVRLTHTTPIDATYDLSEVAVRGATVVIERIGPDGRVQARYHYAEYPEQPGFYHPTGEALRAVVQPLHTYRLEVSIPEVDGAATLRATTTVPGAFRIVSSRADTVTYQREEAAFTLTRSRYPGRTQSFYVFTVQAQRDTRTVADHTPLYRQIIEHAGEELAPDDFHTTTSPILNGANYEEQGERTLTIELPWLAVAFYGPNRLRISVLDDNLYDFFRSQRVQQGGSTLAPGEIPNVIEHIEGGTGVFGSLARRSGNVYIQRQAGEGRVGEEVHGAGKASRTSEDRDERVR